jgi:hypothetical protein
MRALIALLAVSLVAAPVLAQTPTPHPDNGLGFKDTPILPGLPWHVHDPDRPHPPVVTPGALIPEPPPADAIVLFNGKDLTGWHGQTRTGEPTEARWKVSDGILEVAPGTSDLATTQTFSDIQLHVEWASPSPATGSSQDRGNSGVILPGHFEVQVLDAWDNPTYADGQAGAIYGQFPPLVNPARRPGEWNSYDIVFRAPRMDGATLKTPPSITVLYNGIVVQNNRVPFGPTIYRNIGTYTAKSGAGPITLQNHNNAVRFRNIWVRRLDKDDDATH